MTDATVELKAPEDAMVSAATVFMTSTIAMNVLIKSLAIRK